MSKQTQSDRSANFRHVKTMHVTALARLIRQAARRIAIAGAENSGSLAAIILCRCTIIAAANSGASRLRSGTEMKAAISSPARNTVPACRRRSALASASGPVPHRRELEELAAEQIAVDDEEGGDVDAGHQQQQQRHDVADDHHAEEFQRLHERRPRAAMRGRADRPDSRCARRLRRRRRGTGRR